MKKRGFTLIELLVVMTIISILVAILLPAVNAAKDSARASACKSNMQQLGRAIKTYEEQHGGGLPNVGGSLPTGGEGTDFYGPIAAGGTKPATKFSKHSLFVVLLPFVDNQPLYNAIDPNYSYRDTVAHGNYTKANADVLNKVNIGSYLCPANPYLDSKDPAGFGNLDYFATVYTDVSDGTSGWLPVGVRDKTNARMEGALSVIDGQRNGAAATNLTVTEFIDGDSEIGPQSSAITDGEANTIAIIEDAGRVCPRATTKAPYGGTEGSYIETAEDATSWGTNLAVVGATDKAATTPTSGSASGKVCRGVWRWADPDAGGSGVSGYTAGTEGAGSYQIINQNNQPVGGPAGHLWTSNNQGLNDEPFSFHRGGCYATFCDGHVELLSDKTHPAVMRYLITRAENKTASRELKYTDSFTP